MPTNIKRWLQFDSGGSLAANQALADSFLASIKITLGYPNTAGTVNYATRFTYNSNYSRVEIISDYVYNLLTGPQMASTYEDFKNLCVVMTPTNSQAYQMNASNRADIVIKGVYTGNSTGPIEANFKGGAYSQISTGLTNGAFTLTLPNKYAGQGTVNIRPVNDPTAIIAKINVLISDVFLIAGQSNHGEQATNTKNYTGVGYALVFNKATRRKIWGQMNGTDGTTQAYWPLFANSYAASNGGRPCAFIECAIGGTTIDQWQKTSTYIYHDLTGNDSFGSDLYNLYNRALQMVIAANTGGIKAILWHQGEADAIALTNGTTFQTKLNQVANDFYSDLGVEMGVCKIQQILADAAPHNNVSVVAVNTAIGNLWGTGHIWQGPDFSDITPATYENGYGNIHLKTDSEVAAQGSRWWDAYAAKYPPVVSDVLLVKEDGTTVITKEDGTILTTEPI